MLSVLKAQALTVLGFSMFVEHGVVVVVVVVKGRQDISHSCSTFCFAPEPATLHRI